MNHPAAARQTSQTLIHMFNPKREQTAEIQHYQQYPHHYIQIGLAPDTVHLADLLLPFPGVSKINVL